VTAGARQICPFCRGEGYVAGNSDAEIASVAAGLREACRAVGASISGDDRVDEATAAVLVGRKVKTLRNWRHTHRPIPYVERFRRISYSVGDIAHWLAKNSKNSD
jgi:hypothetical protein